jgi:hypothetical protein
MTIHGDLYYEVSPGILAHIFIHPKSRLIKRLIY